MTDYSFVLGKRFPYTKLTPIKLVYTDNNHKRYYLFRCECGNEKVIRKDNVVRRKKGQGTVSCGCRGAETWKEAQKKLTPKILREAGKKSRAISREKRKGLIRVHQFENKAYKGSPYIEVTEKQMEDIWEGYLRIDWDAPKGKQLIKVLEIEDNEYSIYAA